MRTRAHCKCATAHGRLAWRSPRHRPPHDVPAERMVAVKYTVKASRWDRGWELRIEGVGVTQSRGLADAEKMVRSYLRMDLGPEAADGAEIEVVPVLEEGLAEEIGALRQEIAELAAKQRRTAARSGALVQRLRAAGFTGADTAAALKLSPQRVSQLLRRAQKAS